MDIDPKRDIQRVRFGNQTYVLAREEVYDRLLQRLDSAHAALQLHRTRDEVSVDLVETLVNERLTPEQVRDIVREPTFGKRIALLREFRGFDQTELARRVGVSQSTISKLERGETARPSFDLLHGIMAALELPDVVSYVLLKKEPAAANTSRVLARV